MQASWTYLVPGLFPLFYKMDIPKVVMYLQMFSSKTWKSTDFWCSDYGVWRFSLFVLWRPSTAGYLEDHQSLWCSHSTWKSAANKFTRSLATSNCNLLHTFWAPEVTLATTLKTEFFGEAKSSRGHSSQNCEPQRPSCFERTLKSEQLWRSTVCTYYFAPLQAKIT